MKRLDTKSTIILRYWATGMVFIIVVWLLSYILMFFQGFFEFLIIEYENFAIPLVYALGYIIIVPYILGRVIEWVSKKFF